MSLRLFAFCMLLLRLATSTTAESPLPVDSDSILRTPTVTNGEPQPGKRISVTPIEYAGTNVHHTVYLPNDWTADGESLPIIFEYTGNHYPASGSTGEVADAGLGFGLSAGQFIWVTLPFIGQDHQRNQITWWGDKEATVEFAKAGHNDRWLNRPSRYRTEAWNWMNCVLSKSTHTTPSKNEQRFTE
jgi:hypothetical protein